MMMMMSIALIRKYKTNMRSKHVLNRFHSGA